MFKHLIVFFISSLVMNIAHGKEIKLESLQVVIIYKFTNYIEWPAAEGKVFNIGVLNNLELYTAMKEMFEGKLIGKRPVVVKHLKKLDKSHHYNILHVGQIDASLANEIKQLNPSGLLITTQSDIGLHEHAVINFYIDKSEKLRFEINNEKAISNELKINSRLLNLSRSAK